MDVKLPFILSPPTRPPSPEPIQLSLEEVDELRETVFRIECEKEELYASFYKATSEKSELSIDLDEKDKLLIEKDVELEKGKNKRQKVKECISGVKRHIGNKNQQAKYLR